MIVHRWGFIQFFHSSCSLTSVPVLQRIVWWFPRSHSDRRSEEKAPLTSNQDVVVCVWTSSSGEQECLHWCLSEYFSLDWESWHHSRSLRCHSAPDLWGTRSTFWRRGFGAAREHTLVPCLDLEEITDYITGLLWWVHVVFWLRRRLWFLLIAASGQIKNVLVYFFMKCWCM